MHKMKQTKYIIEAITQWSTKKLRKFLPKITLVKDCEIGTTGIAFITW